MATWGFLRRRALLAAIGALLVGVCGGMIAAAQVAYPFTSGAGYLAAHSSSPTGPAHASVTDTATASQAATATSAPTPTFTPQPTPTPPIPGTLGQIRGRVASTPGANSFTLETRTRTFTVTVDANTTVTVNGAPAPLSSVTQGMDASVQGTWSSVTDIAATAVSASTGDN